MNERNFCLISSKFWIIISILSRSVSGGGGMSTTTTDAEKLNSCNRWSKEAAEELPFPRLRILCRSKIRGKEIGAISWSEKRFHLFTNKLWASRCWVADRFRFICIANFLIMTIEKDRTVSTDVYSRHGDHHVAGADLKSISASLPLTSFPS